MFHDSSSNAASDFLPLSKAQMREIDRRLKDMDDPRRYVIKSTACAGSKLNFFYDVAADVWSVGVNGATHFKRKYSAIAIKRTLDRQTKVLEVMRPVRPDSPKAARSSRPKAESKSKWRSPH